MVECNFADEPREAAWNTWYTGHLTRIMTLVPGIRTAQRFRGLPGASPKYRALYEIDSGDVFNTEGYRKIPGGNFPLEWRDSICDWHRNLLEGLKTPPEVPLDRRLLMVFDSKAPGIDDDIQVSWVTAAGLDRSIPECGIAVIGRDVADELVRRQCRGLAIYEPLTPRKTLKDVETASTK